MFVNGPRAHIVIVLASGGAQHLDEKVNAMLRLQRHRRIGQQQPISAGFTVNSLSRRERPQNRPPATGINRDVRAPGQFTHPARITLGLSDRQIARDGNKAEDL